MNAFDRYTGAGRNLDGSQCVAVAGAAHIETLKSIRKMQELWGTPALLYGDKKQILRLSESIGFSCDNVEIIDESDSDTVCAMAVSAVSSKRATVLMKGGVHTSTFSKALLDKRAGLLPPGGLMGHLGMFELPFYHKPLFITDSAINIEPDLEKKIQLARNACRVMRSLGIDNQKVALLAPVEKVNHRIQSTLDAAAFTVRQQEAGVCPFAEVDGPYAMDVIISRQAAEIKGITSDVAGDADLIICPNLDTANAVYKILTFVHGSRSAGIIAGLTVPVVLTSRSDHEENRFNSLGMALSSAHAPD